MNITRKTIRYIGFYSLDSLKEEDRISCLPANNKMDYVCSALIKAGYCVNIISPSWSVNKSGYYGGRTVEIRDNLTATICPTFGANNKIARGLSILYSWIWLLFWMLVNINHNETVIVYHSLWIISPLSLAMRIKRFKVVLEVEEIYCKVYNYHSYIRKLEENMILRADKYIFSNDILPETDNKNAKPFLVVYGNYEKPHRQNKQMNDGKIHLVYSGYIDKFKAGAFNAVESARYLDNNYIMHILGFGDRDALQQAIETNKGINGCNVILHDMKTREEYVAFMQGCHIGLSTQTASGSYLDYQFPSKILSYLSLGLRVVSANIECVTKSKISDLITYYTEDTPDAIADAIKSIDINTEYCAAEKLEELDELFVDGIKKLLE